MLHVYATTVVIYTLIIWAETKIFTIPARDNGWLDTKSARAILNSKDALFKSFILALVPFIRFIFAVIYVVAGLCKKEDVDNV